MSYGEVSTNDMVAEDRPECPHNEQDSEWQNEFWTGLKATGYEHRVCRNCGFHLERRPRKELTEIVLPLLGQMEYEPNVFDMIGQALLTIDAKRFDDVISEAKDIAQEVKDG